MLRAVLKGKRYGSGIDDTGHLTLTSPSGAEDILSAVFFSRLAYLPEYNVSRFFSYLLPEENMFDGIEEIEFWPSWKINDGRVEPDVVMVSGENLIVIEAKRYDNVNMQTAVQLARELVASRASEISFTKIILLTVGGMASCSMTAANQLAGQINAELQKYPDRDSSITDEYSLICQSWKSLYQSLKMSLTDEHGNMPLQHSRLLNDIYQTLIWHGIHVTEFTGFESLPTPQLKNVSFPSSFSTTVAAQNSRVKTPEHPALLQNFSVTNRTKTSQRNTIPQLFSGTDNG